MRRVYIVGHNMAGYMPESDVYIVGSKARARSASYRDAREDQSALNEDAPREYRYSLHGKDGDYWLQAEHGASYHYWASESGAEIVTLAEDERCGNCETTIDAGDRAYYVSDAECYICRECL
jgi:hypothetical protein